MVKKYRYLTCLFTALALVLSNVMCAVVAYHYCALQLNAACSAPASAAFLLCIPYGAGVIICAVLAWFFNRKSRESL